MDVRDKTVAYMWQTRVREGDVDDMVGDVPCGGLSVVGLATLRQERPRTDEKLTT